MNYSVRRAESVTSWSVGSVGSIWSETASFSVSTYSAWKKNASSAHGNATASSSKLAVWPEWSGHMVIRKCWWTIWPRNVHVKSSVVGNVLATVIVHISAAVIRVVVAVVPVSISPGRRTNEALVQVLRRRNVVINVIDSCRAEAACPRRNLLQQLLSLDQVELETPTAFGEGEVFELRELSFRLSAVAQVKVPAERSSRGDG